MKWRQSSSASRKRSGLSDPVVTAKRNPLILRAELSLDGKLIPTGSHRGKGAPLGFSEAEELHLLLHPKILGGDGNPTLTGKPAEFLPKDLNFKLLSVAPVSGWILLRYKRLRRRPAKGDAKARRV